MALVLLAVAFVVQSLGKMKDAESTLFFALTTPLGVFLAYIGVYRSPGLQLLWGGICLFGSIAFIIISAWQSVTGHGSSTPPPLWIKIAVLPMLGAGYLLILDPCIRAYRKSLKVYQSAARWE